MNVIEKTEFLERLVTDKNNIELFNKLFNKCGSIDINYCDNDDIPTIKRIKITCFDDQYIEVQYDDGRITGGYIDDPDASYGDMLRVSIIFLIQELIKL